MYTRTFDTIPAGIVPVSIFIYLVYVPDVVQCVFKGGSTIPLGS